MILDLLLFTSTLAGAAVTIAAVMRPAWFDNHLYHAWLGYRGKLRDPEPEETDHGQEST